MLTQTGAGSRVFCWVRTKAGTKAGLYGIFDRKNKVVLYGADTDFVAKYKQGRTVDLMRARHGANIPLGVLRCSVALKPSAGPGISSLRLTAPADEQADKVLAFAMASQPLQHTR